MEDPDVTVISQYASSPTLVSLIRSINSWLDPAANLEDFYNLIWNVNTAVGYGLDVWGRIVGVGRVLAVASGEYFGMQGPVDASGAPYGQAIFYSGQPTTTNFPLSDEGFRTLILAKAAANITDGSTLQLNRILMALFPGRGNCYVVDHNDMTMSYHFEFLLTPVEAAIVLQSGALPKPEGVFANVTQTP